MTTRFDTIALTQAGEDRVLMDSVRGEPPPPTLKVATNEMGGYRSEINVGLTGLDIEQGRLGARGVLAGLPA